MNHWLSRTVNGWLIHQSLESLVRPSIHLLPGIVFDLQEIVIFSFQSLAGMLARLLVGLLVWLFVCSWQLFSSYWFIDALVYWLLRLCTHFLSRSFKHGRVIVLDSGSSVPQTVKHWVLCKRFEPAEFTALITLPWSLLWFFTSSRNLLAQSPTLLGYTTIHHQARGLSVLYNFAQT